MHRPEGQNLMISVSKLAYQTETDCTGSTLEVAFDTFRCNRLGEHNGSSLNRPADQDLCRGFIQFLCSFDNQSIIDSTVSQLALEDRIIPFLFRTVYVPRNIVNIVSERRISGYHNTL